LFIFIKKIKKRRNFELIMKKRNLKGSVVLNPVPAVLVTCKNSEGKDNVFTVAWVGTICSRPPMLSISIRPERLSYDYIKETMEFTINLPNKKQTTYIEECPINIECKVKDIIKLGSHDMFIAEVLTSHINEDLFDEKDKIHFEKADLISYSHGEYFALSKDAIGKFGYSVAKKKKKINKKSKK